MLHEEHAPAPGRVAPARSVRRRGAVLLAGALGGVGLIAQLLGCNVILGGAAAVVLGGAGVLAAQCYDQVSVHVHDESGVPTCDAHVSVGQGNSFHPLQPCYHASLTSGTWRFAANRDGYEPAQMELTVPERKGACPHYTHSVELTLRRLGAPREAPFTPLKAPVPAAAPAAQRPRPVLRLGPPVAPLAAPPTVPLTAPSAVLPPAPSEAAPPPDEPPAPAAPPAPPVTPLPEPREAP